jgi:3'-phosphoadenosine 5'-phosphosulfate sulfotransferase (PAPS reductase)/FAD synthetase
VSAEKETSGAVGLSSQRLRVAVAEFNPTHVVSMVSGGKDSACSHAVAEELGVKIDLIIHGNTRCGIPDTSRFVENYYGSRSPDFAVADAGTAYEDYVLRKGFFGTGIGAHGFAYHILKADPFRKTISRLIRQRKRDIRVMLLNGARKDESENRQKHLQPFRRDPSRPNNMWVNVIHDWTQDDRDDYLTARDVPINPVAKALCRSGECMCGTMQTKEDRVEAAALYPEWGAKLDAIEAEARRLHGFGWGEPFPKPRDERQIEMFQPMCKDCVARAA